MSSPYFQSLSENCKKRYQEKLSVNGIDLPDPLDEDLRDLVFNNNRFPIVSIFDIYTYLVEKSKIYSKLSFTNYTSLPCFNYVSSGKVKNTRCFRSQDGISVVTAKVEASQTIKKHHTPWIVAKNDGEILSGHCTCMAGLGETCSHVGAVLFFIEKTIREEIEKPACTSEPCRWNKISSHVEPAPVAKIDFSKPKKQPRKKTRPMELVLPVANDSQFKTFLQNVKTTLPSAAIFNMSILSDSEETDTADEESEIHCTSFTFADKVNSFQQTLPVNCDLLEKQNAFKSFFTMTDDDIKCLGEATKVDTKQWKEERIGRVTASNFGKTTLPSAAIFNMSILSDSEETDTADEESEIHCTSFTFADKVNSFLQTLPVNCDLLEKQNAFKSFFTMTDDDIKCLGEATKVDTKQWKEERIGRVTASNFGKVCKSKTSHNSLILEIMGYYADVKTPPISWGKEMEKVAKAKFLEIISPFHKNLCLRDTGLIISKNEPYLGATPDGVITCDCCEDHLLEVKCPFTIRDEVIENNKNTSHLNEVGYLKESHNYYDQIQGQMAITGVKKSYFVTYTSKDLKYEIIDFDEFRWSYNKPILIRFFFDIVFKEIVEKNVINLIDAAEKECLCKRKKYVSTVQCRFCKKTFHRSCVNLKKRIAWTCNPCKIHAK